MLKKKKKKKTSSYSSQMLNPSETRNMQNKIRYCIIGQSACRLFFFLIICIKLTIFKVYNSMTFGELKMLCNHHD